MKIIIGICIVFAVISVFGAQYLNEMPLEEIAASNRNDQSAPKQTYNTTRSTYNDIIIPAAQDGHYYSDIFINGTKASTLIDTGASVLVLKQSDARHAGIRVNKSEFAHPMSTANGRIYAARVKLREFEIGPIILRDQDAFVLPDDKLEKNLLGMSILSDFGSVEIKQNTLYLRQRG